MLEAILTLTLTCIMLFMMSLTILGIAMIWTEIKKLI